jgi:hypothetical protein
MKSILISLILIVCTFLSAEDLRYPLPMSTEPTVEFWDSGNHGGPEDPVVRHIQENYKPKIFSIGWSPKGHWCYFIVDNFQNSIALVIHDCVTDHLVWQKKIIRTEESDLGQFFRYLRVQSFLTLEDVQQIALRFSEVFSRYGIKTKLGQVLENQFVEGGFLLKGSRHFVTARSIEEFYALTINKAEEQKQIALIPRYEDYHNTENHLRTTSYVLSPFENRIVILVETMEYESRYAASWIVTR